MAWRLGDVVCSTGCKGCFQPVKMVGTADNNNRDVTEKLMIRNFLTGVETTFPGQVDVEQDQVEVGAGCLWVVEADGFVRILNRLAEKQFCVTDFVEKIANEGTGNQ